MALAEHMALAPLGPSVSLPSFSQKPDRQMSSCSVLSVSSVADSAESLSPSPLLFQPLPMLTPAKSMLRLISPESLVNDTSHFSRSECSGTSNQCEASSSIPAHRKPKNASRAPIATGVSTTIPVTGEKPRPQQGEHSAFDDNVLFAIFLILYEKDSEGHGMTVKQICDVLIEQHPEMANLSTKTSNLVSAKLNAYVKRVEKGDSSLKYALSRDWADALPKRMVYVYRGLLAKDYHLHIQNVIQLQSKSVASTTNDESVSACVSPEPSIKLEAPPLTDETIQVGKHAITQKHRRLTVHETGFYKSIFLEPPPDRLHLFVPYLLAPVAASLTEARCDSNHSNPSENDVERDFEVFENDEDEEDDDIIGGFKDFDIEVFRDDRKRSKSMSYLCSVKRSKIVTAAAAAPRVPRSPLHHSPNAAAAAAALHAAALRAIPRNLSSPKKWLNMVGKGFLTQEIGHPEDLSLLDLEKFF